LDNADVIKEFRSAFLEKYLEKNKLGRKTKLTATKSLGRKPASQMVANNNNNNNNSDTSSSLSKLRRLNSLDNRSGYSGDGARQEANLTMAPDMSLTNKSPQTTNINSTTNSCENFSSHSFYFNQGDLANRSQSYCSSNVYNNELFYRNHLHVDTGGGAGASSGDNNYVNHMSNSFPEYYFSSMNTLASRASNASNVDERVLLHRNGMVGGGDSSYSSFTDTNSCFSHPSDSLYSADENAAMFSGTNNNNSSMMRQQPSFRLKRNTIHESFSESQEYNHDGEDTKIFNFEIESKIFSFYELIYDPIRSPVIQ
jgi:hypothetical protein